MRPSSTVLIARAESPSRKAVMQIRFDSCDSFLTVDDQQRVGLRVEQVVDAGRDRLEADRRDDPQPGRRGTERHAHRLLGHGLPLLGLGSLGVAPKLQLVESLLRLGQPLQECLVGTGAVAGIECSYQSADLARLLLDLFVQGLFRRKDHLPLPASC
jgi:hypothetical protein